MFVAVTHERRRRLRDYFVLLVSFRAGKPAPAVRPQINETNPVFFADENTSKSSEVSSICHGTCGSRGA